MIRWPILLASSLLASSAGAATIEELDAATASIQSVAQDVPLSIETSLLIDAEAQGYGIYTPRASTTYKSKDVIQTYIEPVGVGWRKRDDGASETDISVDLHLRTGTGKIALEQPAMLSLNQVSRLPTDELGMTLTLNVNKAPPGPYVVEYVLHDRVKNETTTVSSEITIEP